MYLFLLLFNNYLFILSHSSILESSSFIVVSVFSTDCGLAQKRKVDNVVSSAYSTN